MHLRAAARSDVASQFSNLRLSTPLWLTEFGYGLDRETDCLFPQLMFGGLHGAFHASRILAAINTQIGCSGTGCAFGAVTFETFAFRDPSPPPFVQDWCGMPAGTCAVEHANRPDLARVTGTGQLVSHLSALALASQTMHAVSFCRPRSEFMHSMPKPDRDVCVSRRSIFRTRPSCKFQFLVKSSRACRRRPSITVKSTWPKRSSLF
jgi:hypothetical protein